MATKTVAYTELNSRYALTRIADKSRCAHAILTAYWPYLGRKIAYVVNNAPLTKLSHVAAKAIATGTSVVLRVYETAPLVSEAALDETQVDARLWHDQRISVRALGQFRSYAPKWLQKHVSGLMASNQVKEAEALVSPYTAYAVHAMELDHPRTICVDFDGVLSKITEFDPTHSGEPIDGAIDALHMLVDRGYDVVILSSRASTLDGQNHIEDWLDQYGAPANLRVTSVKVPAEIYLDDRAVQFQNWDEAIGTCLAKEPGDQAEIVEEWLCRRDATPLKWEAGLKQYACTACGDTKPEWALAVRVVYAYVPGDLVSVRTPTGTTLGTAHLIYRAGSKEEEALGASGLWLARFADGAYLPVGEDALSKLGSDEDARVAAVAIVASGGVARPQIGSKDINLDTVAETALTAHVNGLPADVALARVAARYKLDAMEMDAVGMTALGLNSGSDEPLSNVPVYGAVCDALDESDRYFRQGSIVPTVDDENTLVLGYLAEAFHWQDELLDERALMRVAELTRLAREAQGNHMGHKPPTWVTTESDAQRWDDAVVAAGPDAGYAAITDMFRAAKQPPRKPAEEAPLKPDPDNKEYTNVSMPSMTSVPESDYDVVRFQTVATGDKTMDKPNFKRNAVSAEDIAQNAETPSITGGKFNASAEGCWVDNTRGIHMGETIQTWAKTYGWNGEQIGTDDENYDEATREAEDYLNSMAPEGYYFGYSDGMGDFGMWKSEDDIGVESRLKLKAKKFDAMIKFAKLSTAQRNLATEIRANLDQYTDSYIESLGGLFSYEWDPGSMWEVRDVSGKRQIVRVERPLARTSETNDVGDHAYKVGQELVLAGSVVPESVRVTALLGDEQYKVKSILDGREHMVCQDDLYLPAESELFS